MSSQAARAVVLDTEQSLRTYSRKTRKSAAAHVRADNLLPGGTSRQAGYWAPYPLTFKRAEGPFLWDIDGNRYFDLINNYTAMVHGHSYPPIVEAARRHAGRGTGWVGGNFEQLELAEEIVGRVAAVEQVRFTNSGTEAGALAFNIARKLTGREKLLMARYGYHGSLLEFETGSFGREGSVTLLADYNDLAAFERVIEEHGNEIAAVFLEPVLGSGGVVSGDALFLHGVQAAARQVGALLVLGMFMDQLSMMLLTVPIFFPLAIQFGFDPVWFAVIVLLGLEISLTTPPFGLLLFVMKGVAPPGTGMRTIYLAAIPFMACGFGLVLLLVAFPDIALVLVR